MIHPRQNTSVGDFLDACRSLYETVPRTAVHHYLIVGVSTKIGRVDVHDDPRKIKIKAKISIEYSFSIVGTGVLDCPMS